MSEPVRPAASTDNPREDAEQKRGCAEEHGVSVEAARNEAEQVRQVAEDARDVRDQQREALETIRQEHEQLRDTAETARAANEQNRRAAEAARHAVVDGVRKTADTLDATLEHMKAVEEMRRTLRDVRDVHKLDSN
jgi:methyl-accepting chemotaxis protein